VLVEEVVEVGVEHAEDPVDLVIGGVDREPAHLTAEAMHPADASPLVQVAGSLVLVGLFVVTLHPPLENVRGVVCGVFEEPRVTQIVDAVKSGQHPHLCVWDFPGRERRLDHRPPREFTRDAQLLHCGPTVEPAAVHQPRPAAGVAVLRPRPRRVELGQLRQPLRLTRIDQRPLIDQLLALHGRRPRHTNTSNKKIT
jgi:hypothetical protein